MPKAISVSLNSALPFILCISTFYNEITDRQDLGKLFENFCCTEFLSNDFYSMTRINFWRTANQTEIDFIVRPENGVEAVGVKWESLCIPKSFQTLKHYYPETGTRILTQKDFTGH